MPQFKMATYSKLGNNGRLGNQLFQIAAVVGAVNGDLSRIVLPPWKYAKDFSGTDALLFDAAPKDIEDTNCTLETGAFQYTHITCTDTTVCRRISLLLTLHRVIYSMQYHCDSSFLYIHCELGD